MSPSIRLLVLASSFVVTGVAAWAQQTDRAPVVGVLTVTVMNNPIVSGFHDAMQELGYVQGRNIRIEDRGAGDQLDRLPELARELAGLKADVIVALNTRAALAAMEATTKPVVFLSGDPVGSGLAVKLSSPGGNATGISMHRNSRRRRKPPARWGCSS